MSFISDIEGIFDPGGDPAAIRRAAATAEALASSMRDVASTLDQVAADLGKTWKGKESSQDKAAAEAFQEAWAALSAAIGEYADGQDKVATALNNIAAEIASAQAAAKRLWHTVELAAAIAAGTALFSFGASEIAAAAEISAASAEGVSLMAALGDVLTDTTGVLDAISNAIIRVTARFLMGATLSFASEALIKWKEGLDPFNAANYSAEDVGNILLGGALTASLGEIPSKIPAFAAFLKNSPVLGAMLYGSAGGALGSSISQKVIDGTPIDWTKVGESALVSGGTGAVMGGAAKGISVIRGSNNTLPNLVPDPPNPVTAATGISGSDVLRGSIGIPSGAIFYLLNFPKAGQGPTIPSVPGDSAQNPVAGATPTVAVVKDGGTLWEITGGSQKQIQQIAKLDGIPNANLIYPGEVVVEPASSGTG